MNAFSEYPYRQAAGDIAAQRRRAPQPLVVAALRIQTDDERWVTNLITQCVQMRRQINATALLGRLDQQDASSPWYPLRLQRGNGGQRTEYRVAIVGSAASVQLAIAHHRFPGSQSWRPAGEFRLLVQVTIQLDAARQFTRNVDEQQRCHARQSTDVDANAGHRLNAAPLRHQLHGLFHVAVALPLRIEVGRSIGNADVRLQPIENRFVPYSIDEATQFRQVHKGPPHSLQGDAQHLNRRVLFEAVDVE